MKTLIITSALILVFTGIIIAQETEIQQVELDTMIIDSTDTHSLIQKENPNIYSDSLKKDQKDDGNELNESGTTTIRIGKKRILIIEKNGSTSIEIPKDDSRYSLDSNEDGDFTFTYRSQSDFTGHWSGLEWGFNGFMTPNHSTNMTGDNKFLELRQGRSWNINLNFLQYSLGFGSDKVGLVTGLGLEFNDYHFRNPITLKVVDGSTVEDNSYHLDPNINVTKTKLSTIHLTAPLLMEFQIPTGSDEHRIFFSAGVIGGVRIKSHTKIVYDGESKGKDKGKDDFNLSAFRYGFTTRVGYRGLKLFANYYPTPLFEDGKGPEVYPFSVGLVLLSL